jgi:hypothetical protein
LATRSSWALSSAQDKDKLHANVKAVITTRNPDCMALRFR